MEMRNIRPKVPTDEEVQLATEMAGEVMTLIMGLTDSAGVQIMTLCKVLAAYIMSAPEHQRAVVRLTIMHGIDTGMSEFDPTLRAAVEKRSRKLAKIQARKFGH